MQEGPFEVLGEGRLPRHAARLLDPDRRRDDRLVRAALGPQRDARRRADEDRLPAGVDAERPRLVRARDERVVDRAHRQQRAPVRLHVAPSSPSSPTRLTSAMPSSTWRPWSDSRQRTSVSESSANQSMRSPRLQMPAAVDPAAQVRRGGDVGRDGDHVLGDLGRLVGELDEQAPERLLGGARARVRAPELGGHRRRLVALDGLALQARRRRGAQPPLGRVRPRRPATGPARRCRAAGRGRGTARR